MRSRMIRRGRRRGFTLLEMMLVLLILVILGSAVSISIYTVQRNANNRAARSQIDMLEDAAQFYQSDVGMYPTDLTGLRTPPANLPNPKKWQGPYLDKEIPLDPWGNPYQYEITTDEFNREKLVLRSMGPDRQTGTDDDISNYDVQ